MSTCTEEEDDDSEEVFWRKPSNPKDASPVIYDKRTYMRFSEFSMLHHSKDKDSEYPESFDETPGTSQTEQTDQTEGDCSEFSSLTQVPRPSKIENLSISISDIKIPQKVNTTKNQVDDD